MKMVRLLALMLASIWLVGPAGLAEATEAPAWLDMPGWEELPEAQAEIRARREKDAGESKA